MYVLEKDYEEEPPLSGGLLAMYNKLKSFAKENRGKWVVVFDGDWNDPLRKDWFMLVNSYLLRETEFFNWSPYKIDIQYHPKHRILVKYK